MLDTPGTGPADIKPPGTPAVGYERVAAPSVMQSTTTATSRRAGASPGTTTRSRSGTRVRRDTLYLLAGAGEQSDWVRNLQAEPAVTRAHRRRDARRARPRRRPIRPRTNARARSCSRSTSPATTASSSPWRARALPVAIDLVTPDSAPHPGEVSRRSLRPRRGRARGRRGRRRRRRRPPATARAGGGASHQRRSWAHGPLHDTNGPPPSGSAAHRNPAGGADGSPRPDTATGAPSASSSSAGDRRVEDRARAPVPGTAPGHGTAPRRSRGVVAGSPHGTQRTRSAGRAPTHGHRGDHRVGTEHPLHPGERAPGPVGGRGVTAPEPELAAGGGHRGRRARGRSRR